MGYLHAFVPQPRGGVGAHVHRPSESGAIWGVLAALMLPTILATLATRTVDDADGLGNIVWILTLIGEFVFCGAVAVALDRRKH